MTLRIGRIDYANCTPLFHALEKNFDCSGLSFISGVPAVLNGMLSKGEIDICPASSFEYGKSPQKYYLLPDLSISSIGPVKSVLLFSKLPIDELHGKSIGLTTESDTSVNLLKIILMKGYGHTNDFHRTSLALEEAVEAFSALLLIGNAALREAKRAHGLYVYDLGELWLEMTGLPFVFALWMVTTSAVEKRKGEVRQLATRLLKAKSIAYGCYEEIAAGCGEMEWMGRAALVDYWRTISYDLTKDHLLGVKRFFSLAKELGLLASEPALRILA